MNIPEQFRDKLIELLIQKMSEALIEGMIKKGTSYISETIEKGRQEYDLKKGGGKDGTESTDSKNA